MKLNKKTLKYIFLGLFFFTNTLIIAEANLTGGASAAQSNFISFILGDIINKTTPTKPFKEKPVESITLSDQFNNPLVQDQIFTIPIGITRRIKAVVLPEDSTDKSITWLSENPNLVRVTSGGYIEARHIANNILITAISSNQNVSTSFYVSVVEKQAPSNFTMELDDSPLYVGTTKTINVPLTVSERREYDPYKINYHSSDETVAVVNSYGVIKGVGVGTTNITALGSNDVLTVTVENSPTPIVRPTNLILTSPAFGYLSGKTSLNFEFDTPNVSDKSVTFISSNEAIATVEKLENGANEITVNVVGNKVSGSVTITGYSNMDETISSSVIIDIREVLPTSLQLTSDKIGMVVAEKLIIKPLFTHDLSDQSLIITNKEVIFTSSNVEVASITSVDGAGVLLAKKVGVVTVTAQSIANSALTAEIEIEITSRPAISTPQDFNTLAVISRKVIGHFGLFFVNAVFGFFTLFYYREDKLVTNTIISLGIGLFVAAFSEFVQYFTPGRAGAFLDVAIDFAGYFAATIFLFLLFRFLQKKKTATK